MLAIINALVITGRGSFHHGWAVEITDGVITHIGISPDYNPPPGAVVIDAKGNAVIPGIINAHVHDTESEGPDDISGQVLRTQFLLAGVTTTCNMGHSLGAFPSFEDGATSGGLPAGKAYSPGPQVIRQLSIPAPAAYRDLVYEVLTEEQIAGAVRILAESGADYIKIASGIEFDPYVTDFLVPPFSSQQISQVTTHANAYGLRVRAIVTDGDRAVRAANAGVLVFDGVPAFRSIDQYFSQIPSHINPLYYQSPMMPELDRVRADIDSMAQRGIVMVPMMAKMNSLYPWERGDGQSVYRDVLEYFHDRGGRLAVGTGYPHHAGISMPLAELQALQAAGLTNLELITAATYNSAIACGVEHKTGSIEVGKAGDVIIINGNPLDNINLLSSVTHVILDGKAVSP